LACVTVLAGCSDDSGSGSGGTVTLQMVESLTNPARTTLIKSILSDFEKAHPTIKVELVSPPTDQADNKIQQMLQAGSGIDVLEVRDLTVGPFSTNKWLYDMTADMKDWAGWADFTDNAKAVSTTSGGTYFISSGFYGISLFYRKDLIQKAGFSEPPDSWDDLLTQAAKIQGSAPNTYGYAFRGGKNGYTNITLTIEAYTADDIDLSNAYRLKNGSSMFADPRALAATKTYLNLFTNASPPSAVAWGYPEMVEGFSNGSVAFLLQDPEVIATLAQSTAITKEQWTTAPMPVGPTGKSIQPIATGGWGIAAASTHKPEAVKLIQYLSSADASLKFTQGNSMVPVIRGADKGDLYKTGPWQSYLTMNAAPAKYISASQPRGVSWWTDWGTKADADIQSVLINKMTPEQLLAGWDKYWTDKWASGAK